jgi:hypothetical protein
MPVASGNIIASFIYEIPTILDIIFIVIDLTSFTTNDDPTALGYNALTSPDLPIPCPNPKFLFLTIYEKIRPSLSPRPVLPL